MKTLLLIAVIAAIQVAAQAAQGVACEGSVLNLRCNNGNVIKVSSAMYGRQGRKHCNREPIRALSCGMNAAPIVKSICQDRSSCQVEAINGLFGDSCYGTVKYLHVNYECRPPSETLVTACEHGSVTLNCPVQTGIYIAHAMYGRQGRYTCNRNPIETLRCAATNSKPILEQRCRGRRTCTVAATNNVFGDPCHGTVKYLEVRYGCYNIINE